MAVQRLAVTPAAEEPLLFVDDHHVQFMGRASLLRQQAVDVLLERRDALLVQREHMLEQRRPAHLAR
ncbi:hypothetical protein D3C81_2043920 [compost metagenome]